MRLVLTILIAVGFATPAHAATVTNTQSYVSITDEIEQRNELTIDIAGGKLRVTDAAADIQDEAPGCDLATPRQIICNGVPDDLAIDAGSGRDSVIVVGDFDYLSVFGAGGADTLDLSGSGRREETARILLGGGEGRDRIIGTAADDNIDGGEGADEMDGGPGVDELDYRYRTKDLTVDLRRPGRQGERGENDSVRRIENVRGGAGDDVLIGDVRGNELQGGEGRDRIRGGRGHDTLGGNFVSSDNDPGGVSLLSGGGDDVRGERGDDWLQVGERSVADGGAGDDIVWSYRSKATGGPGADTVLADAGRSVCGSGYDRVTLGFYTTLITANCEWIDPFWDRSLVLRSLRRHDDRLLLLPMSCASLPMCEGKITISRGKTVLARRQYRLRLNRRTLMRLPTSQAVEPGAVRVRVTFQRQLEITPVVYDTRPQRGSRHP